MLTNNVQLDMLDPVCQKLVTENNSVKHVLKTESNMEPGNILFREMHLKVFLH